MTVVAGFPGVGKTFYTKASESCELKVHDSDSSKFSWLKLEVRNPDFPQNYIDYIKEIIDEYDIVFVSTHKEVLDCLTENNIEFKLVYPQLFLKSEYLTRFTKRGNGKNFVNMIDDNWTNFIKDVSSRTDCEHIVLQSGEHLTDAELL